MVEHTDAGLPATPATRATPANGATPAARATPAVQATLATPATRAAPAAPHDGTGLIGVESERDPSAPVPYVRGLPGDLAARAAWTRFLPASWAATMGMYLTLLAWSVPDPAALIQAGLGALVFAGPVTAGFHLGLEGLRRFLYPDARVDGRRSVLAGLLSPLAILNGAALGPWWASGLGFLGTLTLMPLVGVVLAVLFFFAWLTPTPPHMRGAGFDDREGGP